MSPDKLPHSDKLPWHADIGEPIRTHTRTRLAVSAPLGVGMLLLAGAVAFGHASGTFEAIGQSSRPELSPVAVEPPANKVDTTPKPDGEIGARDLEPARYEPTAKPKPTPTDAPKPTAEPTAKPTPVAEPTWKPTPQPEPKKTAAPTAAPVVAALALSVQPSEYAGKVVLAWTAYGGEGFEYYKVVRSTDASVTWPPSAGDELVAAIGAREETWGKDRPPCGATWFYRVFAVRKTDGGYVVLAPSNTVSATAACPPPAPTTKAIGLELSVVDDGVQLTWAACASEHFNAYKIVRSATNAEPMYPENAGTELIGVIGDPGETWFVDAHVKSGQTWTYRVLARADGGGGTYIACQTPALTVTIP
ncbi:MAG TPA: hypothetical protein VF364_12335 [Candidatus Limnocylindria bacterium]